MSFTSKPPKQRSTPTSSANEATQTIRDHALLKNRAHSKSLGQHFLTDPRILQRIVDAAGEIDGTDVLEIGPGPGGLTREILKRSPAHLIALEKDPACVVALQELTEEYPALRLKNTDAVTFDYAALQGEEAPERPLKVIANLPYNVGTAILLNILSALPALPSLRSLTLMFQKEVADRILAPVGASNYGRLSVLAQYWTQGQKIMTLAPGAFTPPPKVHSAVIHLTPQEGTSRPLAEALGKVTQVAFQERRKMLRKSLLALWPKEALEAILETLGIAGERRPETLSVEEFVALAQRLLKP